ncbi:hypothetical protein MSTO_57810 [Mycobacterium stomatepiae]|uniref:Uncharacterized protein n=1 Tax=Mycobacterium stomatepiae TaxID=470076 RepID=A0A7I7QI26_9MYCO|nr:hypothetical protein MSTO_57810 [Mycobacterium stomatepiae]
MYSNSVIAMAAVFWPRMLVAIKVISWIRFAAMAAGGTVAANADSYDVAATRACTADMEACAAAVCNHCKYGAAACVIDSEDGPIHCPFAARPDTTESKDDADAHMSAAKPSHAAAAASSGPEPAPPYIRAELISGGKNTKSRSIHYLDTTSRFNGVTTAPRQSLLRLDTHCV